MKTKWNCYILWSVFSLCIGNYVAGKYDSPSTRRPSRRKTIFKSKTQQTETATQPVHVLTTHSETVSSGTELELISRSQVAGGHGTRSQPHFAYLPDVSVTCSNSDFVVRVKNAFYGHGANAEELRLGRTCKSNGALGPYGVLLFTYRITECDVQREMSLEYIVYKYLLHYIPSPKRRKGSAHSFAVNIECRYPRYHHVYQLAVRPTWQTAISLKKLRGRLAEFQIQLMDDTWNMPAKSKIYLLGQTVNLQVSASQLPAGGKVYISSCFATPYSSASPLRYALIDNFGCMSGSQKDPGSSQFVSSQDDQTVRLSFRAFQFTADPKTQVQIQCVLHVSSEGSSAVYKACTYEDNRWRALSGDDYICDCCESQCLTSKSKRAMLEGSANSGPIRVSTQSARSEDHFPATVPPQIRLTAEGELEDILAFETKMNQSVNEQGNPQNLLNTRDLSETSGKEDQRSLEDYELDDEHEGDSSVWVHGATAIGRLNQLGFGWGLITKDWDGETSGLWDLDEFGQDGVLPYGDEEDLLETEESDKSGSMDWSVTKEEDKAHVFSVDRLGLGLLKKKKVVESHVTVASRETPSKPWADDGHEEEGGRERHGGRREEVEGSGSDVEWGNDKAAQGDGLVEADVGRDKEITWYFTWK
ncbi:unnamed protein product [Boreogadus saida]